MLIEKMKNSITFVDANLFHLSESTIVLRFN